MNPEQIQLDALVSMLRRENELLRDRIKVLEKENKELKVESGSYYKETWEHIKKLEKENGELRAYVSDGVSKVGK